MPFDTLSTSTSAGPLTTIFTPPAGCFEQLPSVWSTCNTGHIPSISILDCYWPQPANCYPPNPFIWAWHGLNFTYPADYWYSPGVLPSGFTSVGVGTTSDVTTLDGCLTGWDAFGYEWCSISTSASYVYNYSTTSGLFVAALPRVIVEWDANDLASFSPVSAPVLPTSSSAKPSSSSAAVRSRSGIATSTTSRADTGNVNPTVGPAATSKGPSHPLTSAQAAAHTQSPKPGLSTGAKAGIGVDVAIAALLATIIALVFFQRSRRRTRAYQSQRVRHLGKRRRYVDSKAELPGNENIRNDVVGATELQDRDPQELAGNREPPPIPLASKPRSYNALRGDGTHELA